MRGFLAVLKKEALQMLRDRATLFFALLVPVFELVLFGVIDTTVEDVPTVVLDQSRTQASRALVEELVATRLFRVVGHVDSRPALRQEIVAGHAQVGFEIPPEFARRRLAGEAADFLVLIDGSDSTVSSQALSAATGLALTRSLGEALRHDWATWLNLHVFTGLFGSLLILFHSAFQFRTPIAVVTAASLGIVVITGIAGRYLYALTPRPDRAALEQALASLDELAPGCSTRVYHALAIHKVTQVDTHHWLLAKLAAVPKWGLEARARGFMVSYVIEDAPVNHVLERKERRRFRKAKRAVRKYAMREVVAVGASSLLQSWRGFHRLLAVILVLLVPVHIAVAWIYGYRWIFSE